MEESINLKDVFKTIRKHLKSILILTIFAIVITGLISYFVLTPVYQTSTEILVNQSPTETGPYVNLNIETDLKLINTYSGIIKSPAILDQVVDELNLDLTSDQLIEKITVSNENESQIVSIAVVDEDPEMAVQIANTTAAIFKNEIRDLMNADNITILSPAAFRGEPVPIFPKPMVNMAIAAVISLMLGAGIAFLWENLNTTMKDEQDIKDILDIPLLGIIPQIVEKVEIGLDEKTASKRREEKINGQKEKASPADSA